MININWVFLLIFCFTNINHLGTSAAAVIPGDGCVKHEDCLPLANSYCAKNDTCICEGGFVARNNRCVPIIPEIGMACEYSDDCHINNTVCQYGKCECNYNYVPLSKKECVERSYHGEKCNDNIQCSCKSWNKICDSKEPYADVICARNICSCVEGYHFVENKHTCVKSAKGLRDNCTTDDNCVPVEDTRCIDNQCTCSEHHFENKSKCLRGIGADCSMQDEDCSAVNSHCSFFGCQCNYKYVELSVDQCVPVRELAEDCLIDKQCSCENNGRCYLDGTYKDLVCFNKSCSCFPGFHYVPERYACIQSAKAIEEPCENNDNCKLLSNTKCKQGKCQCIDNYFASEGQCKQGLHSPCPSDIYCSAVTNAKCIDNECQCSENFVPISTGVCAPLRNYGELCQYKEQCQDNRTSIVPLYEKLVCDGTCSCSEGFHYVANKRACIQSALGVGGDCSVNDNCGRLTNTNCWNNQCTCLEYYYQQGEQCVPGIGARCSWKCEATNSICATTGHCICAPGYIFSAHDRCVPIRELGEFCEMGEQCSCLHHRCKVEQPNKDLVCLDGTCSCPTGYHYSSRLQFCIHSATGIGEQCDTDDNCELLLFAECYNKKCTCQENYFVSEGTCKQGLDSFCRNDNNCSAVPNAECVKNECKCKEKFVKQSTELCVPVTSFGEQCEYAEQCAANTENATCEAITDGAGKICRCRTGQHHHATGCYKTKKLDEHCDSYSECFVTSKFDSVECQGNKCVCAEGFTKINESYCDGAGSIVASVMLVVFMVMFKSAI